MLSKGEYILRTEERTESGNLKVKNKVYKNAYVFRAKDKIEAKYPKVIVRIFKEVAPAYEQTSLFCDEELDF